MRGLFGFICVLATALALPFSVLAQDAPSETRVDDIVVQGRPLDVVAEEFVIAISAPPRARGLARWRTPVCIGVVNFRTEIAHLIIDRISEVAEGLGISLGEPGCEPNLTIIGTTDGRATAREMVRGLGRHHFRYGATNKSARSARYLDNFQNSSAPVRWWHISYPINIYSGGPAYNIRGPSRGMPGSNPCAFRGATADPNRAGGLHGCNAITDWLLGLIIIVDVDRAVGVDVIQLADYLTLIALAQIEPDADHSAFDTVLNLFDPAIQVSGLTDWDMIYLQALYSGEDERLDPREQAARMVPGLRQGHANE